MTQEQPWEQLRPWPGQDPGFRLDPNGRAQFRYAGHRVDVHVRYTTEADRTEYSATGDDDNVIIFASVDVAGVTVGRSWWVTDWGNEYSMREGLAYVLKEATEEAERKVDEMARELAALRAKREEVADALARLLGDDTLGRRTLAALAKVGITTPDEVRAKGVAWILDWSRVGAKGIERLAERLGLDMGAQ